MIFNSIIGGGNSIDTSTLTAAPPQVLKDYKFIGSSGEIETGSFDLYSFYAGNKSYQDEIVPLDSVFASNSVNYKEFYLEFKNYSPDKRPRLFHFHYDLGHYGEMPLPDYTLDQFIPASNAATSTVILLDFTMIAIGDPDSEDNGEYFYSYTGWGDSRFIGWVGKYETLRYGSNSYPRVFSNYLNIELDDGEILPSNMAHGSHTISLPQNYNNMLSWTCFIQF